MSLIIYSAKTNKVPLNNELWNGVVNFKKIKNYNINLLEINENYTTIKDWSVIDDIHNTYNILVEFNNKLEKGNSLQTFIYLKENLDKHQEIKNSIDYKCRSYYDKMTFWYNLYMSNQTEKIYLRICDEVQDTLKYLAKQGIVKISGCNLKKNFY